MIRLLSSLIYSIWILWSSFASADLFVESWDQLDHGLQTICYFTPETSISPTGPACNCFHLLVSWLSGTSAQFWHLFLTHLVWWTYSSKFILGPVLVLKSADSSAFGDIKPTTIPAFALKPPPDGDLFLELEPNGDYFKYQSHLQSLNCMGSIF